SKLPSQSPSKHSTLAPTTLAPTTLAPTTLAPTTLAPTRSPTFANTTAKEQQTLNDGKSKKSLFNSIEPLLYALAGAIVVLAIVMACWCCRKRNAAKRKESKIEEQTRAVIALAETVADTEPQLTRTLGSVTGEAVELAQHVSVTNAVPSTIVNKKRAGSNDSDSEQLFDHQNTDGETEGNISLPPKSEVITTIRGSDVTPQPADEIAPENGQNAENRKRGNTGVNNGAEGAIEDTALSALEKLGLYDRYHSVFEEHGITGDTLQDLTEKDLEAIFPRVADRAKFRKYLATHQKTSDGQ
ncbi:hypothetical protein RFI_08391, partial [Reticulomyxa filosa]